MSRRRYTPEQIIGKLLLSQVTAGRMYGVIARKVNRVRTETKKGERISGHKRRFPL
jgi:hypothetical protein